MVAAALASTQAAAAVDTTIKYDDMESEIAKRARERKFVHDDPDAMLRKAAAASASYGGAQMGNQSDDEIDEGGAGPSRSGVPRSQAAAAGGRGRGAKAAGGRATGGAAAAGRGRGAKAAAAAVTSAAKKADGLRQAKIGDSFQPVSQQAGTPAGKSRAGFRWGCLTDKTCSGVLTGTQCGGSVRTTSTFEGQK